MLYAVAFSPFEGLRDANYAQYEGLLDAVKADRQSMLYTDSFRSLVLISLSFGILWLFIKQQLNKTNAIIGFALLILFDLVQVNLRYVNKDDFRQARKIDKPFTATAADLQILKDINLEIQQGELLSIVGPSGSGKSTLLKIIGLLDTPNSGSIKINELDCSKISENKQVFI